ncbi:hypothetical protein MMC26_005030 [Xylographa opegraphella]|nr:hypothetical protein [Xylographa opegraphella]
MAAPEVVTKAPENDAEDQSVFPNDTTAQSGASMGVGPASMSTGSTGSNTRHKGLAEYGLLSREIGALSANLATTSRLLTKTSGTGIYSTNNQLQADQYASEGFLVVMPDQFGGDPAPNSANPNAAQEENPTVIEQVKLRAAETVQSFMLDMWLARQTQEKVLPILQKFIEGAKEEFADAVANGGGIYAVGYCFGGKYVLLLASELPDTVAHGQKVKDEEQGVVKTGPLVKAGAIAHGTLVTKQDLEGVKSPVSMVCIGSFYIMGSLIEQNLTRAIENDQLFPDDVRETGKAYLEENHIEHEIKVYSGVPHGFAVAGEYHDQKIQAEQKAAFEQMVTWLKGH